MSNLTFGGVATGDAEADAWVHYETLGGGAGAGPVRPGAHALQTHMTNTRNTPIEELETALPVRVRALRARRGSGGDGEHPGGDGLEKELLFLRPAQVALVAERHRHAPWGVAGGGPGTRGEAAVRPGSEADWEQRPGKFVAELPAGASLRVRTPGGGGHGTRDEGAAPDPSS